MQSLNKQQMYDKYQDDTQFLSTIKYTGLSPARIYIAFCPQKDSQL